MCVCLNLCYFLTFQTFPDILDTPSSCRGRESWKQNVPIPRVLASINSTRYRPSRSGVPCSRHPVGSWWDLALSAWNTVFYRDMHFCACIALKTWERGVKRQYEQQTQQRCVFRSIWTDYVLGIGIAFPLGLKKRSVWKWLKDNWTPKTARPMHPMFLRRNLEPSSCVGLQTQADDGALGEVMEIIGNTERDENLKSSTSGNRRCKGSEVHQEHVNFKENMAIESWGNLLLIVFALPKWHPM